MKRVLQIIIVPFLFFCPLSAQSPRGTRDTTLYTVGYSHLDTQWRWDYRTTIRDYIRRTMVDNFRLFEKYPGYVFNFTGSNRYRMMKEYYPTEYERVKHYIALGRWFPSGSSVEENDVLTPSAESIMRQVLYGNRFFRREFNRSSTEYMLPDCFGFPESLPSILAHCGIRGFSTQKLTWGSANGIPFTIGVWVGPDSESVVAAFNPGDYTSLISEDLSMSPVWLRRIREEGARTGIPAEYMYYGTGDMGGSPAEASIMWLEKSLNRGGPVRVLSSTADRFFNDITPDERLRLPHYSGELLLTFHSAGSLSSQAVLKRWNRKNELLAYSAEASSVMGEWLGGSEYPRERLTEAWRLVLGGQFHDILAGTCVPKAYEYTWNDEVLASNQFAGVTADGAGSVIRALDTRVKGIPLAVYNALSVDREDVVETVIGFPLPPPRFVRAYDPAGREVPSQIVKRDGSTLTVLILAKVPSMGFAVYDLRPSLEPCALRTGLAVSDSSLENPHYRVKLGPEGDVRSVFDKTAGRELLREPHRLEFLRERPEQYPAWNMDWKDRKEPPIGAVRGPAAVRIAENGPARVSLEVIRESMGSKFTQRIRLASGGGSGRVEFDTNIDWFTKEASLKASFPLTVSNPRATYNMDLGTIERPNNDPKKYEVPSHRWFDLTGPDGSYGISVLEDSKYGSDKPADNLLRLTLLFTPGVRGEYRDQASQDFGRHRMLYALSGHRGDWRAGNTPWEAARLNQPLVAFRTEPHRGSLGREFSFLRLGNPAIAVAALKKAEEGEDIILRLQEMNGTTARDVEVRMAPVIERVREVNAQEDFLSDYPLTGGKLIVTMSPYHPRTFALSLRKAPGALPAARCRILSLPYGLDVMSYDTNHADGSFDSAGSSLPAELIPDSIISSGIVFGIGPRTDGAANALVPKGEVIRLPKGKFNRLYILAASSRGDRRATFLTDGRPHELLIQQWDGSIGQWDNRTWEGYEWKERDYAWEGINYTGLVPGFVKRSPVALFTTHRHLKNGENDPYSYAYLYRYRIDLDLNAKSLKLPTDPDVRILAMTAAWNDNDASCPVSELEDTLSSERSGYERFQVSASPRILPEAFIIEEGKAVTVTMAATDAGAAIRYTIDGSEPGRASTLYQGPFTITGSTLIKARTFAGGKQPSIVSEASYYLAYRLKAVRYMIPCAAKYTGGGDRALIDSRRGTLSFANSAWQGFEQDDLDVIVDLGEVKKINRVTLGCLSDNTSWIFLPSALEISVSEDGKEFRAASAKTYTVPGENEGTFTRDLALPLAGAPGRFVRVKAKNVGICPPWHPGRGGKAWLFADEIIIQ